MQGDDVGFIEWAFKGCVAIIFTVGGWLWMRLMNAVSENKEGLSNHKLHVSENYAKKSELSPIYDTLSEMRGDIKELLGRKRPHP